MKKLLALLCVFALMLTFCGCRETKVETSVLSYAEGEEMQAGTNNTASDKTASAQKGEDKEDGKTNGDKTSGGKDNAVNTGSNSIIDNPLKVDLKGATITIYDSRDAFKANASSSKTAKAKADVLAKIQKELNCKFNVKTVDATKLKSLASTSAASGKAIGGIITTTLHESGYYIASNLAANVTKISSMDLTKSYMNRGNILNASQFGKGKYVLAADCNVGNGMYFNKRILKEIGYDEDYIYDLVDKGKWTYSQFRAISKKAVKELDGKSGMSANDQWGMVARDYETANTADLLVSSNTPMVKLVSGKLKLNTSDPKIVKMANLAMDVMKKDGSTYWNSRGNDSVAFFNAGKALFYYSNINDSTLLTSMKDEFGFVPVPKVDGAKTYASAVDWNVATMMIPAGLSAQDQYNAGAVVQAYMYLMDDVVEAAKKEYVNRYFCDEKSGDNMVTILNTVTAQPAQCYAKIDEAVLTGTYRVFWNYLGQGKSPAAAIESTKVSCQKALDDLNKKIKDK